MKSPKTLREEVIRGYKSKCSSCGEREIAFLVLTRRDLKPLGGQSRDVYFQLKESHWPKTHTLLCYNCKIPVLFERFLKKQVRSGRYTQQEAKEYIILREEACSKYGSKCQCCGETDAECLIVDHRSEYLTDTGGMEELLAIKKLGWPKKEFRLLCYNCNRGTMHGKICPHKA